MTNMPVARIEEFPVTVRPVAVTRIGARSLFYCGQENLHRLLGALRPMGVQSYTLTPPTYADKTHERLVRAHTSLVRPLISTPVPDVYLTDDTGFASIPLIQSLMRRPVIYMLYDDYLDLRHYRPRQSLRRPRRMPVELNQYVNYRMAKVLLVGSEESYRTACALRGSSSHVYYFPVSVDCARFDPGPLERAWLRDRLGIQPETVLIGYVGRVEGSGDNFAGKPLVTAAKWLASRLSPDELRFAIVGYGSKMQTFRAVVEEAGLTDYFHFPGYIPDKDYPTALTGFDIAVATLDDLYVSYTRSESKTKEYLASGRAIVATGIGENIVDLDHGNAGLLCAPDNANLGEKILTLVEDAQLRHTLGAHARARAVEHYDTSALAPRLYEAILAALT